MELKIIAKFIKQQAKKHKVKIDEIQLCIKPAGFISVWQYIEDNVGRERIWRHLETTKIK